MTGLGEDAARTCGDLGDVGVCLSPDFVTSRVKVCTAVRMWRLRLCVVNSKAM